VLYPRGRSPGYPRDRRLGGPQSRSGCCLCRESKPSSSAVRPVAISTSYTGILRKQLLLTLRTRTNKDTVDGMSRWGKLRALSTWELQRNERSGCRSGRKQYLPLPTAEEGGWSLDVVARGKKENCPAGLSRYAWKSWSAHIPYLQWRVPAFKSHGEACNTRGPLSNSISNTDINQKGRCMKRHWSIIRIRTQWRILISIKAHR
jgi:hypothetical protein